MKHTLFRLGLAALLATSLAGCLDGKDGKDGKDGAPGAAGAQGPAGGGVSIATMTAEQWAGLKMQGRIDAVSISAKPEVTFTVTDAANNPILGLENNTTRATNALANSYANVSATIAKLVPGSNGSPSKWVSYVVTTMPNSTTASVPTRPSSDNTGTLSYLGNGQYKYTFYRDIKQAKAALDSATYTGNNVKDDLGDVSYEPSLTHRVVISISGNMRGTGTNTATATDSGIAAVSLENPTHLVYDWVPATGTVVADSETDGNKQRNIVNVASCMECHAKFSFHGGGRQDTKFCVTCHTDQRKYGRAEATATATGYSGVVGKIDGMSTMNLPVMVHKIHMGEELTKTNVQLPGFATGEYINEIRYPQVITNCVKCHDGTTGGTATTTLKGTTNTAAQGNNWKTVPSRIGCGSCHDNVDFTTGAGHEGGAKADDSTCTSCHTAEAIDTAHIAVTPANTGSALHVNGGDTNTNAAAIASVFTDLPVGAIRVSYDVKSVSRNANKNPVMVFRLLQNGVPVPMNAAPPAGSSNEVLASSEIWDNFMGAPSLYWVFGVPQDGITTPVDLNASASVYLRSLWNGKASGTGAGTLTYDAATGYYTATLTGTTVPDTAAMLTGGIGYTYNVLSAMPLTQTNVPGYPTSAPTATTFASAYQAYNPNKIGGLIVLTPDQQVVGSAGCTAGAPICTSSGGYVARRTIVDDKRCNNCHQELGVFNKASFHGGQRNDGSTCAWCHTANRTSAGWPADSTSFVHAIHAKEKLTVPFTWHRNASTDFTKVTFPGVLNNCEACHVPGSYDFRSTTNAAAAPNRLYRTVATGRFNSATDTFGTISPRVVADNVTNYGTGFSFSAATGVSTEAAGTTLVNSPIATTCFACHDTNMAKWHMETNGGSIYAPRSEALARQEQCLICHGTGRIADIKVMHAK